MRVSVVRPQDLGAGEIEAWRDMQRATAEFDNAFLAPGFALAAARVRPASRVAVIEDGGRIAAFMPFERGPFGVARPIAPTASNAQAVVHVPGYEWDPRELLAGCGVAVWEFDHLIARQIPPASRTISRHGSWIIDVSSGYDAYVEERLRASKRIFKSTLYKRRKLERDVGETRFEFDSRDGDALGILMRWKSAQYRRTGRRDRFKIDWLERLVRDLFESSGAGCTGTLSVLYAQERVVAAHFGLRSDRTLFCWYPSYDVELAKYSPGLDLHLRMAEAGSAAGVENLDLGRGDEEYKQSLKTRETTVGDGWLDRPSAVAVVRRAQRAPRRAALNFVLSTQRLRRAARGILRYAGSLRER